MRVGVNALLLTKQAGYRQTGVSRYIRRLLEMLPEAMPGQEVIVYAGRDVEPFGRPERWRRSRWPVENPSARIAWETAGLPFVTRKDGLEVFHGTVYALPPKLRCASVVTIHDLAFLRWPDQTTARRQRYLARAVASAVKRADRIIAISDATKNDIVELLQVDPERIAVTRLGVDDRFRRAAPEQITAVRALHELAKPFVLYVGTLEPRKNLPALLRAFAAIKDEIPHDLVLAGAEGWRTKAFRDAVDETKLGDRLRLLGFVAEDNLPALYSAADLFAFPSLYEGFGLPVLEAMACGTPVVASNVSSLPEVAGNAALLVNPEDEDALGRAMVRALTQTEERASMIDAGLVRATRFSWRATARATAAVYQDAFS